MGQPCFCEKRAFSRWLQNVSFWIHILPAQRDCDHARYVLSQADAYCDVAQRAKKAGAKHFCVQSRTNCMFWLITLLTIAWGPWPTIQVSSNIIERSWYEGDCSVSHCIRVFRGTTSDCFLLDVDRLQLCDCIVYPVLVITIMFALLHVFMNIAERCCMTSTCTPTPVNGMWVSGEEFISIQAIREVWWQIVKDRHLDSWKIHLCCSKLKP